MQLVGLESSSAWRWVAYGVGGYLLLGALGMFFYSRVGQLTLAQRLLDRIPWHGDERVLDGGCGQGFLTVAAARRWNSGSVMGLDVSNSRAPSGNRANSVLENAKTEGVGERVKVREGDARALPFDSRQL